MCKVIALSGHFTNAQLSQTSKRNNNLVKAVTRKCDCLLVLSPPDYRTQIYRRLQTESAMRVIREGDFFTFEPYTLEVNKRYEPCNTKCFMDVFGDDFLLFSYLPILRFLKQENIWKLEMHSVDFRVVIKKSRSLFDTEDGWSIIVELPTGEQLTTTHIEFSESGEVAHVCHESEEHAEVKQNMSATLEWIYSITETRGLPVTLEYGSSGRTRF